MTIGHLSGPSPIRVSAATASSATSILSKLPSTPTTTTPVHHGPVRAVNSASGLAIDGPRVFSHGDSGAFIAGPEAKFTALLTGGTGPTDSTDITYGTPMWWLWEDVIKPEFPGANLSFDLPNN